MGILTTHWYYNTETGQLTRGNSLTALTSDLGLAGWHELNIAGSASASAAGAEAKKEFPDGATPTTAGITASRIASTAASEATGGSGGNGTATSTCLIKIPVVNACILSKTQARALIGGAIIGLSGVVVIVGLALITAEAMEKTGAGNAAGKTLETAGASLAFIPGGEAAGLALGAAGATARRAGSTSGARQSLERRRAARTQRQRSEPERHTSPGQPLSASEVKTANANRRRLERGRPGTKAAGNAPKPAARKRTGTNP